MKAKEIKKPAKLDEIKAQGSREFSAADRALLERYGKIAISLAKAFGSGCEVVVNSLEDLAHSIVEIANGQVTGRTVGSPITNFGLEILNNPEELKEEIIGPYFSETKAGKPLKSVTLVIRNDSGTPIGMLCVNFDLSMPLSHFLREFSPTGGAFEPDENFAPDVGDLVGQAVADELESISHITGVSPTEKNRRVVANLEHRGIFDIKGSVELVAGELGVTKHTIYKYLRELRGDR
jgi:predicted transcriptional regulator YheO